MNLVFRVFGNSPHISIIVLNSTFESNGFWSRLIKYHVRRSGPGVLLPQKCCEITNHAIPWIHKRGHEIWSTKSLEQLPCILASSLIPQRLIRSQLAKPPLSPGLLVARGPGDVYGTGPCGAFWRGQTSTENGATAGSTDSEISRAAFAGDPQGFSSLDEIETPWN